MSIEDFPDWARVHWAQTRQALQDGTYRPQPVRQKDIPKPNGGERMLGIPTVIDRVIQQAVAQVLEPEFDPHFSESSFGFRPGRSAHGAIKQVQRYLRARHRIAVDHDILMSRVSRRVSDKGVLRLIGRYLRAGVEVQGVSQPTTRGVPKEVLSRRCSRTSCSTTWTRNSSAAVTDSRATPTMCSSPCAASGRGSG